ncbi:MAG: stage sporulation protein [Paenibacillaceae bacterium]|jgi:stage II sporulation protein R|nr:stage sporulation protein [Paenibacillaceae bacterium]
MVKRYSWKSSIYLALALIFLLVTWEHNRAQAAVVDAVIPEESIRLRILANSDSPEDQVLKRQVRDAIVAEMNGWVLDPENLEDARTMIRAKLPELSLVVEREIARYGYDYNQQVELGVVPFPAKMYGNKVYPAGDYEALRVTIGQGAGQNWWCVLFPALCFVDTEKGEAVPASSRTAEDKAKVEAVKKQTASVDKVKSSLSGKTVKQASAEKDTVDNGDGTGKKKVRFYLWDKVKSLFA